MDKDYLRLFKWLLSVTFKDPLKLWDFMIIGRWKVRSLLFPLKPLKDINLMLFSCLYLYSTDGLERTQMEWIKNECLCVFEVCGGGMAKGLWLWVKFLKTLIYIIIIRGDMQLMYNFLKNVSKSQEEREMSHLM